MTTAPLILSARQFRALVDPVLPLASRDDMLPVLAALLIKSEGKWLTATATDRFRLGIKRIAKVPTEDDDSTEWPQFEALVPVRAVRSILATYKPTRGFDPTISLAVEGDLLAVEAAGAFDLFDSARFTHRLESAEYPGVQSILTDGLGTPDDERQPTTALNPAFLADFKGCGRTLRFVMGRASKPIIVLDDEGFIGAIMPRRTDLEAESWDDVLVTPTAAKSKKTKGRAA